MLGGEAEAGELAHWLAEHARIERAQTPEQAVRTLSRRSFDYIISPATSFNLIEDILLAQQLGYGAPGSGQGVCVVDAGGQALWAQEAACALPDELRQRVLECCRQGFESHKKGAGSTLRAAQLEMAGENGRVFDLTVSPLYAPDGEVAAVAGVIWDATDARRLRRQIDAIDRAGRELVRLDGEQVSRLDTHERLSLLEQKIIRYTRDLLHFDNFAVFVIDKKTNKLDLVLASGMANEVKSLDLYAYEEGNGICGFVAARGTSFICPDVRKDARYLPGASDARSSLTVPLRLNDQLVGVFNVESVHPNAFTEEDRQFAQIFGRYIAVALHILELLVTERFTTTGRLGRDIMADVTGPLNDIQTEVETLTEDYLGLDDLRHRLRKVSENLVQVRDLIRQATSPKSSLLGARPPRSARLDPILKDKRILIVDDEDMIRETVRDVLSGYGCHVSVAGDGEKALELIGKASFDLVLSDIKLPCKNGYEVFAAAKAANAKTPVILMTGFGYDPNHSIVRANREGLTAVLFKPFKVDQLLGEIRTAVRNVAT